MKHDLSMYIVQFEVRRSDLSEPSQQNVRRIRAGPPSPDAGVEMKMEQWGGGGLHKGVCKEQ